MKPKSCWEANSLCNEAAKGQVVKASRGSQRSSSTLCSGQQPSNVTQQRQLRIRQRCIIQCSLLSALLAACFWSVTHVVVGSSSSSNCCRCTPACLLTQLASAVPFQPRSASLLSAHTAATSHQGTAHSSSGQQPLSPMCHQTGSQLGSDLCPAPVNSFKAYDRRLILPQTAAAS